MKGLGMTYRRAFAWILLAAWTLGAMSQKELRTCGGFVPFWADGSLLEVEGKRFDAIKVIKGKRGQVCAAAFCGPVMTGMDFADGCSNM